VATAAGISQSTVSQIELGRWDAMSMRTLCRVFDAVEADIDVNVRYRGGQLDRLLDERHAATASAVSRLLSARG
jgi:transcriptional regulator with XRE-family HTH domain